MACLPQKLGIYNQLITNVYEIIFFSLYSVLNQSSKKHRSKKQHSYSDCIFEKTDENTLVIRMSGVRLLGENGQWGNLSELVNVKAPGFASTINKNLNFSQMVKVI